MKKYELARSNKRKREREEKRRERLLNRENNIHNV
jgi:hypothetical protein